MVNSEAEEHWGGERRTLAFYHAGEAGRRWVRERLEGSGTPAESPWMAGAAAVRPRVNLDSGEVVTIAAYPWLPRVSELCWGEPGVAAGGDKMELLARWIREFVEADPAHLCLVDEPMCRPGDAGWERWVEESDEECRSTILYCAGAGPRRWVTIDGKPVEQEVERPMEILYRIGAGIREESICRILTGTYNFYFCCALVVVPEESVVRTCPPRTVVTLADVMDAVREVKGLVVDAYDVESVAIWTPRELPPGYFGNPW